MSIKAMCDAVFNAGYLAVCCLCSDVAYVVPCDFIFYTMSCVMRQFNSNRLAIGETWPDLIDTAPIFFRPMEAM